jgi:integrase/recombinase XerC
MGVRIVSGMSLCVADGRPGLRDARCQPAGASTHESGTVVDRLGADRDGAAFDRSTCEQLELPLRVDSSLRSPGPNTGPTEISDLRERGRVVAERLLHGRPLDGLLLSRSALLAAMMTVDPASVTVAEALALVTSHLEQTDGYRTQTVARMSRDMARMAVHLSHYGLDTVADIDATELEAWIVSATTRYGAWTDPSVSTCHFRLSTARLFFRVLRQLHVTRIDPTLDIELPPRSALSTRPLTDDEETVCRLITGHTLTETRRPVAWALGQATATTAEQAAITVGDLDLDQGRVWIHGSAKRTPRWGWLTDWGLEVVQRAVRRTDPDPSCGLVYAAQSTNESGTASVCRAVHNILRDAGYSHQPDIRPGSLPAWAGRRLFDNTGSIDVVARSLGLTSLDQAARVIGWDWNQ